MLYTAPLDANMEVLPSPADLMNKIVIKVTESRRQALPTFVVRKIKRSLTAPQWLFLVTHQTIATKSMSNFHSLCRSQQTLICASANPNAYSPSWCDSVACGDGFLLPTLTSYVPGWPVGGGPVLGTFLGEMGAWSGFIWSSVTIWSLHIHIVVVTGADSIFRLISRSWRSRRLWSRKWSTFLVRFSFLYIFHINWHFHCLNLLSVCLFSFEFSIEWI